jgi:flagellar basal-body rod protein FlgB
MNGVEGVLQTALRGLALRQRTIADNIANVETPGFLAGRVDFETSLREATAAGRPSSAVPTVRARSSRPGWTATTSTSTPRRWTAMQTNMRYELTITALTNKFNGMRAAIGRR